MVWLSIALASPEVVSSTADEKRLDQRISDEPADLVILYGGEQDGQLGTCGCPGDPKGSLGRVESWRDRAAERNEPVLLVNVGNWLTDPVGVGNALHPSAFRRNAAMLDAVTNWDALNVSFRDLPYLGTVDEGWPAGVVSANASGLPDVVSAEVNGRSIAIVGVTAWKKDYLQPEGVERIDPIEALETLLPTLEQDLVVVLSYGLGKRNKAITALDVDVLIDGDTHRSNVPALVVDDTVWVRSRFETQYLGELRLQLDDDGVTYAHDRAISMDRRIPTSKKWRKKLRETQKAMESI